MNIDWASFVPVLDVVLRVIGYLIGFSAICIIIYLMGFRISTIRNRIRVSTKIREKKYQATFKNNAFYMWYDKLLLATISKYKSMYLTRILLFHRLGALLIALILGFSTKEFFFSIITAIFFAYVLPISFLYFKLMKIRTGTRNEIQNASIRLMQYYHENNKNMMYALKELSQELKGEPKKIFAMFFIRLQSHFDNREKWAEIFAYSIGTLHGRNLSVTILKAVEDGTDVEKALSDLNDDISQYKQSLDEMLSKEREVAQLGKLPIFAIPITMIINAQFMQTNVWAYHFGTSIGIQVFTFAVVMALVGYGISIVFEKPKDTL